MEVWENFWESDAGGDVGKVALEIGLNPDGSTAMGNRTIRSRGQTSSPNFMANRIIRS